MAKDEITGNKLQRKGLTLTILFEGQSLNYDEGFGNLAVLKKLNRGSGRAYTYASRQSIRYSIFIQGVNEFGWKRSDVSDEKEGGGKTVTQLISNIAESEESDLFGYMRTGQKILKTNSGAEERASDKIIEKQVEKDDDIPAEMKKTLKEVLKALIDKLKEMKIEAVKKAYLVSDWMKAIDELSNNDEMKIKIDEIREKLVDKIAEAAGFKHAIVVRTTPVKLTPAISLEPFASNTELLTNKYQADKIPTNPNMANIEQHRTIYRYTICVDLARIGTEEDPIGTRAQPGKGIDKKVGKNDNDFQEFITKTLRASKIDLPDRAKRVCQLLNVIGTLYRDIRGRREDLKPLFIIGGIYDSCNPYFENIVNIEWELGTPIIIDSPLAQVLAIKEIRDSTNIGIRAGYFENSGSLLETGLTISDQTKNTDNTQNKEILIVSSPEYVINKLKESVKKYYDSAKSETPSA